MAGRARIALSAALLNETDWTTGATPPAAGDYAGQELQEEEMLTGGQLSFIESGRYMISLAEGGDTGRLQVPELDVHTVSDQLIPVPFEATYAERVALAGSSALLRQVYVNSIGHCNFTDADTSSVPSTLSALNRCRAPRGRKDAGGCRELSAIYAAMSRPFRPRERGRVPPPVTQSFRAVPG